MTILAQHPRHTTCHVSDTWPTRAVFAGSQKCRHQQQAKRRACHHPRPCQKARAARGHRASGQAYLRVARAGHPVWQPAGTRCQCQGLGQQPGCQQCECRWGTSARHALCRCCTAWSGVAWGWPCAVSSTAVWAGNAVGYSAVRAATCRQDTGQQCRSSH